MKAQVVATLFVARVASAQSAEVSADAQITNGRPRLELEIRGVSVADAPLVTIRVDQGPGRAPDRVVSFEAGPKAVAYAFVLEGQEVFVGNDTFETDENARYKGLLVPFEAGFDSLGFTRAPAGSQATIITYATGTNVRLPLGPIAKLQAKAFGTQGEYKNFRGTDLALGIEAGVHALELSPAAIKVLVAIGSGEDTNNDTARGKLAALRQREQDAGIEEVDLVVRPCGVADCEGRIFGVEGLLQELGRVRDRVAARFYATLYDDGSWPWDGQFHDVTLRIADREVGPFRVKLPDLRPNTAWWQVGWKVQIGVALGVLALIAVAMRIRFALRR
jgi:hypothetical protein